MPDSTAKTPSGTAERPRTRRWMTLERRRSAAIKRDSRSSSVGVGRMLRGESPSMSLLDIDPDLADVLDDEERAKARRFALRAPGHAAGHLPAAPGGGPRDGH